MLRSAGEIVIHKHNWQQFLAPRDPNAQGHHGLAPRDFFRHPCGSLPYAPKSAIQKIPRSEWSGLIKEMTDSRTRLSDIRDRAMYGQRMPSRDQNGRGYCWAHSTVSAALLGRARMGLPYADLSAYHIACIIKGYADQGGWNGESMEFLAEKGCATSKTWPQQSTNRSNDNAAMWAEAALYKDTEWEDIEEGDFDMQMTHLLLRNPSPLDLNWWSHSICAADPVDGATTRGQMRADTGKLLTLAEFDDIWEVDVGGGYGIRIWNSWGDSWSDAGMGVLTESKSRNNGSIALRGMRAA